MRFFLLLLFTLTTLSSFAFTVPVDSVGLEHKDGKTFILHRVEEKETLYSLSRRYNVSIYQIIQNNPPTEFGLEVGQIVRVPFEVKKQQEQKQEPVITTGQKVHIVKPKETMFSISKMYGVTIDELKTWNNLSSNILDIGQRLVIRKINNATESNSDVEATEHSGKPTHVVQQGETLYSISRQYGVGVNEIKEWNSLQNNEISIGQQLIVGKALKTAAVDSAVAAPDPDIVPTIGHTIGEEPKKDISAGGDKTEGVAKEEVKSQLPVKEENTSTTFEEITQSGLAELIEGSNNTRKYLALHRTAKIGTIMRVRNEMNGQEVFVRVMGRLPDTGVNNNVLIKISKSAYDRLGAIDPRFRVSISYIP